MVKSEIVWDEPNEVDNKWVQFIDDNVLASNSITNLPVHFAQALTFYRASPRYQTLGH
jgi:hypothetical protein